MVIALVQKALAMFSNFKFSLLEQMDLLERRDSLSRLSNYSGLPLCFSLLLFSQNLETRPMGLRGGGFNYELDLGWALRDGILLLKQV